METLRERDWRSAFECLGRIVEAAGGSGELAPAAVQALAALVPSELTTLSVCDLATGRRHVNGSPQHAIGAAERECFDRHFREHPLVRFHAGARGRGAHRISDSVPFARFRHTALYADYYRPIGIDHVVALPIWVDERTLCSFVLNRRRRDFSDRERGLLDRIGAPLSRLCVQARAHCLPVETPNSSTTTDWKLTAREREVMHWLAAGKTDREIAALLGCSHRTVHKHLQHAYEKLGVETRTAAAMRFIPR